MLRLLMQNITLLKASSRKEEGACELIASTRYLQYIGSFHWTADGSAFHPSHVHNDGLSVWSGTGTKAAAFSSVQS